MGEVMTDIEQLDEKLKHADGKDCAVDEAISGKHKDNCPVGQALAKAALEGTK